MGHRKQFEVSSTRVERTRASNEPDAADKTAPILLVREHPPFLLNGPTSTLCLKDVEDLLSERQRQELVRLFFRFVQPAFPVLRDYAANADSDQENIPEPSCTSLSLSICIYATALPFSIHNDYLNATLTDAHGKREKLYSMAVDAILQELNSPTLETLQACLLLLQKGPTTQHQGLTPTYSCFSSLAVTIAKSLGLQHDCSTWNISPTEKQLRHRLWWATFVHDMWISVDTPGGRAINFQDYDVQLPNSQYGVREAVHDRTNHSHFDCLATLTHLLSQIYETYFTIRASKDMSGDLFRSLEFAKPLRSALNECKQRLKVVMPLTGGGEPGASGSVILASCVTEIILFRALLRPIRSGFSTEALFKDSQMSAAAAVLTGSINCAKETVELLETMVSMVGPWTEFWHSWSQGNFAIVSTFLVQLNMMSDTDSRKAEIADLISRWKRAIRIGAGSGGWGSSLMSMALSRLDALLVPASSAKGP
ncbi:hypothetical protein H2200_007203 [Cladophialophora chaetospira]|uniref:Xylanolytic transcriptional activator regulatory domain-containing protein n=1 Tax=Cladophialophora chaetospira TaxID=386627 RepID=A0AA39CHH3_9EURO|nr:hypothetical protein H2200_007203 [Cladophialophora chaetospira]